MNCFRPKQWMAKLNNFFALRSGLGKDIFALRLKLNKILIFLKFYCNIYIYICVLISYGKKNCPKQNLRALTFLVMAFPKLETSGSLNGLITG